MSAPGHDAGAELHARPVSGGSGPTFADINRDVIKTLEFPSSLYFGWMSFIALTLAGGIVAWIFQIYYGMGMAGKRNPQMWAMYITTFVFWIGIGHAGTLISAILYLFRARWRTSIYRGSEAMTIFAVMTAGLFPVIHLGRWIRGSSSGASPGSSSSFWRSSRCSRPSPSFADPAFPLAFTLGPGDVMLRGRPFEGEVTLTARLKRDGTTGPAVSGDLEGATKAPVRVGQSEVQIVLDQVR